MNGCSRCKTEYVWRSYPRFLRSKRDKMWAGDNGKRVESVTIGAKERPITWVERLFCDCAWRFQMRAVDVQLLELLLPDYWAQGEIRRRAA